MDFLLIKRCIPKIPHIKLECVALCGLGSVGGLSDPHRVPTPRKKRTLLDKPPFLALKRCVKNIISFIICYTRNFLFGT
jgi:hypothetical protein